MAAHKLRMEARSSAALIICLLALAVAVEGNFFVVVTSSRGGKV